jgi:ArsR family transcriptional regulator, arsenate/arsenite/antimonite-responsive transcriptional repressor
MDAAKAVTALGALAHEHRLAIYRLLVEAGPDGLAAGAIADRLAVPPSSLTFHLQHLTRAGLIGQRRAGRQLLYATDFAVMNGLVGFLTENCCGCGRSASRAVCGQSVSGQSVSGHTAKGQTAKGQTVSGETVSGQTVSGQTVSGQTVSGETVSRRMVAGRTVTGRAV